MKRRDPLMAAFRCSSGGHIVFRPLGLISPLSVVLESADDIPMARRIYWTVGAVTVPLLALYAKLAETGPAMTLLVTLLVIYGASLLMLLGVSLYIPGHEIYRPKRHGKLTGPYRS
ncbi:hypothetical protein [uncultured Algimonas sp.]|uniref:hypothetical protein n=1 Tax=uncultured Algimonas sp. TaxID=1547920 RepID=UPI00261E4626|nr:hypothetical protein [uncultured Algimonas sp.]